MTHPEQNQLRGIMCLFKLTGPSPRDNWAGTQAWTLNRNAGGMLLALLLMLRLSWLPSTTQEHLSWNVSSYSKLGLAHQSTIERKPNRSGTC